MFRFLIIAAVFLIPAACLPFYTFGFQIFLIGLLAGFALLTIRNSILALCFLLFISIFFGNHPGGKYLEIFDFLLMIWVALSEFVTRKIRVYSFSNGLEWAFLFSGVLSILSSRYLIKDISQCIWHPYFILASNETQSFFVVKMLLMTAVCIEAGVVVCRLRSQQGDRVLRLVIRTVLIASALAILAGILEVHSSAVTELLRKMRFAIDRDFGDTTPHELIPFLKSLQGNIAAKGLFWNRGWFAEYLVAAFPFLLCFFHGFVKDKRTLRRSLIAMFCFLLFFYSLLLIGARGAFIAFVVSIGFYAVGLLRKGRPSKWFNAVPYLVLAATVVFPLAAIVDWMQPVLGLRTGFFKAGLAIGSQKWLFGGGIEGFGWNNTTYLAGSPIYSFLGSTHNEMLQVFSGQGLLGIVCYVFLIAFAFRSLQQAWTSNRNSLPLMAGLLGVVIYSCFQEWFYLRSIQLLFWLLLAFSFSQSGSFPIPGIPKVSRKWVGILSLLMLCAAGVVSWKQSPPPAFGFSPPISDFQRGRWRLVTGKEGWCPVPSGTTSIKIVLRNPRPESDHFNVTVEVLPFHKEVVPFNDQERTKVVRVAIPAGSRADTLRIGCNHSWRSENYSATGFKRLCISALLRFDPGPYDTTTAAITTK